MKKTGIGLAVAGLILSLFLAFGGKLPVLEKNIKITNIVIDKVKELHRSKMNNEIKNTIDNNNNQTDSIIQYESDVPSHSNYIEHEPNYSRIHKNRFRDHRDYITDENGKIYENKPCYNCSGEGYTIFTNPASGNKEINICNACKGIGQIGYEF